MHKLYINNGTVSIKLETDELDLIKEVYNEVMNMPTITKIGTDKIADVKTDGNILAKVMNDYVEEKQESKNKPLYLPKEIEELNKDFQKTGIKYNAYGKKYKTRYICTSCGNAGTHYVPIFKDSDIQIECHECKEAMEVKSVEDLIGEKQDAFGNYFVAGKFIPKKALN